MGDGGGAQRVSAVALVDGGALEPLAHSLAGTPVGVRDEFAASVAVKTDMVHHLPGSPSPKLLVLSSRHGGALSAQ
jgi:hypothetical protein